MHAAAQATPSPSTSEQVSGHGRNGQNIQFAQPGTVSGGTQVPCPGSPSDADIADADTKSMHAGLAAMHADVAVDARRHASAQDAGQQQVTCTSWEEQNKQQKALHSVCAVLAVRMELVWLLENIPSVVCPLSGNDGLTQL
jgi:hypothetical protein